MEIQITAAVEAAAVTSKTIKLVPRQGPRCSRSRRCATARGLDTDTDLTRRRPPPRPRDQHLLHPDTPTPRDSGGIWKLVARWHRRSRHSLRILGASTRASQISALVAALPVCRTSLLLWNAREPWLSHASALRGSVPSPRALDAPASPHDVRCPQHLIVWQHVPSTNQSTRSFLPRHQSKTEAQRHGVLLLAFRIGCVQGPHDPVTRSTTRSTAPTVSGELEGVRCVLSGVEHFGP